MFNSENTLIVKTKTGTKRRCKRCQADYMAKFYKDRKPARH